MLKLWHFFLLDHRGLNTKELESNSDLIVDSNWSSPLLAVLTKKKYLGGTDFTVRLIGWFAIAIVKLWVEILHCSRLFFYETGLPRVFLLIYLRENIFFWNIDCLVKGKMIMCSKYCNLNCAKQFPQTETKN